MSERKVLALAWLSVAMGLIMLGYGVTGLINVFL
jgi:hypothetical protein